MKIKNKWIRYALIVLVLVLLGYSQLAHPATPAAPAADGDSLTLITAAPDAGDLPVETAAPIDEDGAYTTKEDLALYLHSYGHLPSNFITKAEAKKGGWPGGALEPYFPGMCIGGDRFGNREGLLPDAQGRVWYECDVNTLGASLRGMERLVYSNDGLIYYTSDHYASFEQLY